MLVEGEEGSRSIKGKTDRVFMKNERLQLLQENYILQLIKDEWSNLSVVRKRLQQLQLGPLAAEDLKLQIAAVEIQLPPDQRTGHQERKNLVKLAFKENCREMSARWKGIYPFGNEFNSGIMYFVVILKSGPEHSCKTQRFVEELKQSTASHLKLECAAGIGQQVKGLKRLKNAYTSCMFSWNQSPHYKEAEGERRQVRELMQFFTPEVERMLTQVIENLDMNTLRLHLDALFSSERPMFISTFLALRLLLVFSSIAQKFELGGSAVQKYLWKCQMSIADYQSREGLREKMEELALLVMDEVQKVRFSSGRHMIEAVRKDIREHFCCEQDLSSLAERFHFNAAYLSGLFKQHVGIPIDDYITRLRMAEAEQLLQENKLKVADIAMYTGYSSFTDFCSSFKKYSGKNPKDYRDRYLKRHARN
ncbi:helix-turn-helix transcriptional regulator [Paenibacillus sp. sgz5001063]|uniref:helix-turn-helix transcriptional regulator n=1 Tax=Paenibacillus sp. sgz5001063 TaxID=3242474 RepID=UPI0036D4089E